MKKSRALGKNEGRGSVVAAPALSFIYPNDQVTGRNPGLNIGGSISVLSNQIRKTIYFNIQSPGSGRVQIIAFKKLL
jgi:hypothetical protein